MYEAIAICTTQCPVMSQCQGRVERDPPEYGVWAGKLYQPNGRHPQQPDKDDAE